MSQLVPTALYEIGARFGDKDGVIHQITEVTSFRAVGGTILYEVQSTQKGKGASMSTINEAALTALIRDGWVKPMGGKKK